MFELGVASRPPSPVRPLARSSLRPAAIVTAGAESRLTGSNLYGRHMLEALRTAGVPSSRLFLRRGPYPLKVWGLRSALRWQNPSLVVVDSPAFGAVAPLVPWIKEELGASLVILMNGLPSEVAPAWRRPITRGTESRLLRAADCTVAASPFLRSRLMATGVDAEKVVVIPPGRDSVSFANLPTNGHLKDRFRFLCVANWSRDKGIHLAIEALAEMEARVHLDLVGDGQDRRYARGIFKQLKHSHVAGRVHIYGPLEGEALARRYLAADAFVLPSQSVGFGTAYAEAMSFGLPVVAFRVGPMQWLVEQGCGMLVPPGDLVALTEAMRSLSSHPPLPRRMGEAAFQRALRLPTWKDTEIRFLASVEGLLR